MKRKDAELVGELVKRYLRNQSLESPLNEQRLLAAWSEVLGPTIDSYTDGLYIRNQTLFVHLTSSVLRQELLLEKQRLVTNLNKKVGAAVITNIVFH